MAALGLIVSVAHGRGQTVRQCAQAMALPFVEVDVKQFDDPYQVPRVLKAMLEAPTPTGFMGERSKWLEKVLKTPLLGADGKPTT